MKQSQLGTTDLFIAVAVFIILITIIALSWNRYVLLLNQKTAYSDLQIKANHVSDLFVKTSGSPGRWENLANSSNIIELGLAGKPNIISNAKAQKFVDNVFLSDDRVNDILNIGLYDFYFRITEEDGTTLKLERNQDPSALGLKKDIVRLKRSVFYENENDRAILEIALWEK